MTELKDMSREELEALLQTLRDKGELDEQWWVM